MKIHEDPPVSHAALPTTSKAAKVALPIVDTSNTRPRSEASSSRGGVNKGAQPPLPPKPPAAALRTPSHFLSEINVDDCFDFRAIPDPPSPRPNKRRLSTSMLPVARPPPQVVPLAMKTTATAGKRSRKSLCHVPSPLVTSQEDLAVLERGPSPPPPVSLHVQICLDEDDALEGETAGAAAPSSPAKRRKKRTSMELPRELVVPEPYALSGEEDTQELSRVKSTSSDFQGSLEDMKTLQALVRGYCRRPKSDRGTCPEAQEIQEGTRYPLMAPSPSDPPASQNDRHWVLQHLAPVIEQMDQRKALDTKKWQDATGCRVERSRSGKYRYISMETNQRVKSQEYQRRYRQVLHEEAWVRLERADAWKEKLLEEVVDNAQEVDKSVPGDEDTSCPEVDIEDVLKADSKPPSTATAVESDKHDDVSMEMCDLSVSMDMEQSRITYVDAENALQDEEDCPAVTTDIVSCHDPSMDEDKQNDLEDERALQPIRTATEEICELRPKSVTPTENIVETLPLPDRDDESSDPEIAKAERQLWSRIDQALQDYSYQVMTIVKSRQTKKNHAGSSRRHCGSPSRTTNETRAVSS